jgi:hypothetical protein
MTVENLAVLRDYSNRERIDTSTDDLSDERGIRITQEPILDRLNKIENQIEALAQYHPESLIDELKGLSAKVDMLYKAVYGTKEL